MTTPTLASTARISSSALRALSSTAARPFSPCPQTPPPRARRSLTTLSCSRTRLAAAPAPALASRLHARPLHTTTPTQRQKQPQQEARKETDLGDLDVLASAPIPSTAVEVCHADGFSLNSGVQIQGGAGALLVSGKAFCWKPWLVDAGAGEGGERKLVNEKGQWDIGEEGFALLSLVWPRPDLLILGLGPSIRPLSPATRRAISNLGMRVEVLDTRNAASQYNLLATERGVEDVAAALLPLGWKQ